MVSFRFSTNSATPTVRACPDRDSARNAQAKTAVG